MMHIGENISVIASFGVPYKLRPVKFRWAGRLFEIKGITYAWNTQDGQSKKYHFSVTDGKSLYEISFDTSSLLWMLENLEA